jgi:peptidoglycan/xylan/chitin deacetylase (PgdA/CDA1 family)
VTSIANVLSAEDKLACMTLDYEMDYGDRIDACNIFQDAQQLDALEQMFSRLQVPISAFIRTDLLSRYPESYGLIKRLAQDYHCHSHTHNVKHFDSVSEISQTAEAFERAFGYRAKGYRAPQGVLYPGDIALIKEYGFEFSSSVFPSYRPGKFNNLRMPEQPFVYENEILELPFSVVPKLRYTISLSYLKLLGFPMSKLLFSIFGMPNIIVFDSHLHDFIVNAESYARLPLHLRMAWGVNKRSGPRYFEQFVSLLKEKEYKFVTMTQLYETLRVSA